MKPQFYTRQKVDELLNGVGGKVVSVNGKDGEVVLTGNDIHLDDDPDGSKTLTEAIASAAIDADQAKKAVGNKLDKTTGGVVQGNLLVNTNGSDLNGVGLKHGDKYFKLIFDEGLLVLVTNYNGGVYGVRIPYQQAVGKDIELATISDITDATKLTPVYAWTVESTASYVNVRGGSVIKDGDYWKCDCEYALKNPQTGEFGEYTQVTLSVAYDERATVIDFGSPGVKATRGGIDHYTLGGGSEELLAGTKAGLFAGADFTAAVESVFDNGETEAF